MKLLVLVILGVLMLHDCRGQAANKLNIDTLLFRLKNEKSATEKVSTLRLISEYYRNQNPDTALLLAQQSLDLARNIKADQGEIAALFTMGKIFVSIGNYTKALELYLQSLQISERINSSTWMVINYNHIGELYSYQSAYTDALKYYLKAVSIADKEQFYSYLADSYYHMSMIFEDQNRLDSAKIYGEKSYRTLLLQKDPYMVAKILNTLGNVTFKLKENARAMDYFRQGIPIAKDVGDNVSLSVANLGLANIFQSQGQMDSSLLYARSSLDMARKSDFMMQVMDASDFLSGYYKKRGNYDSALSYKEIYIAAKDSLVGQDKIASFQRISFEDQLKRKEIERDRNDYRNRIRFYILLGGLLGVIILAVILWRSARAKHRANLLLDLQKREIDGQKAEIEASYKELEAAQAQLIQSEKMASLGELTAGIAHEIQNPLNFVNNFSEVNSELLDELKTEIVNGDTNAAILLAENLKDNADKIMFHGKRAGAIVKGMLQHSRTSSGKKEPTDINALTDEYLRLAYHGLRAKDKTFNAKFDTDFDPSVGKVNLVAQDAGRVILNLINNAFYAVNEKAAHEAPGFEPKVVVQTRKSNKMVEIRISDNGGGVPQKILDKIFQPFFTTKPSGQGTGLGLSLSYDVVRAHGGDLKVESQEGKGATFVILIPDN